MAENKSTGFGPGRPRKGESRPLTEKMIKEKAYRDANRARIREKQREYRETYDERHPGRATEHRRESLLREKTYGATWKHLVSPRYPVAELHNKK